MKKFKMSHRIMKNLDDEFFDENHPPKWLIKRDNLWFWNDHILTLPVNGSKDTDFRTITRIE